MQLKRTGKMMPFLDVHIGNPFWAHDGYWVRTDGSAATRLESSGHHGSCCDFLIDGTVRPTQRYGFPNNDLCEEVEAVELVPVEVTP
jgi:hypothetical protein